MLFHYDKYTSSVDIDNVYNKNWYGKDWYNEDWYDDNENCFKQTDVYDDSDTISSKSYSQYLNQNINKKYYY